MSDKPDYEMIRKFTETIDEARRPAVRAALIGVGNAEDEIERLVRDIRNSLENIERHLAAGYRISDLGTQPASLAEVITKRQFYWDMLAVMLDADETAILTEMMGKDVVR